MRKFFVVLVWVMGLGLAALFAKDIVRGVKNVIAINHFTPVEVNNAPTSKLIQFRIYTIFYDSPLIYQQRRIIINLFFNPVTNSQGSLDKPRYYNPYIHPM